MGETLKRNTEKLEKSEEKLKRNTEKLEEKLKSRKSELSKSKKSRIVNGKINSKSNLDSSPSPSPIPSRKNSFESTNAKIYKNDKDEESSFKIYYENNKSLLEKDYPHMPKSDIKTYLRKIWDGMDEAYRKKMCKNNDKNSSNLYSTDSSLDEDEKSVEMSTIKEQEISMEANTTKEGETSMEANTTKENETSTDISIKENKKTKIKNDKIDKEENSVSSEQDGPDVKRAKQDNV